MKGFPFKRHLILLVTCLLAIGVIIPLATFAKSSSGEPRRPSHPPKVTVMANPATGNHDPVVTIMEGCPPSMPINSTGFNAGDVVTGNASFTSSDTGESTESEEVGDTLQVFDTTGQLATQSKPLTILLNGTMNFSFTATAGDQLFACFALYDGDEIGMISYTVTPAPFTITLPNPNNNWAGYSDHNDIFKPAQFTRVDGSWKVPSLPCASTKKTNILDIWDGLGGIDVSLEQTGVRLVCINGKFAALGFYELLNPGGCCHPVLLTPKPAINAGDTITATTRYLGTMSSKNPCKSGSAVGSPGGKGVYQFFLSASSGWHFVSNHICGSDSPDARNSADWIVEGHLNIGPLLNFNRVDFTNCSSNNGSINVGPIIYKHTLWRFLLGVIPVQRLAFPSSISTNGNTFTVYWQHG